MDETSGCTVDLEALLGGPQAAASTRNGAARRTRPLGESNGMVSDPALGVDHAEALAELADMRSGRTGLERGETE